MNLVWSCILLILPQQVVYLFWLANSAESGRLFNFIRQLLPGFELVFSAESGRLLKEYFLAHFQRRFGPAPEVLLFSSNPAPNRAGSYTRFNHVEYAAQLVAT